MDWGSLIWRSYHILNSDLAGLLLYNNTAKASASWEKIFKLGIAAGCHIGFGSYLAITVGGACPAIAEANPGLQKVRKIIVFAFLIWILS